MSFELILPFLRPIEGLLLDDSISEIMGNPDSSWWCERDGKMHREDAVSFDAAKLLTGLEVIANRLGKKLDEDNLSLNAQLPDGCRLAAWIPPIVRPSPALAIRKFTSRRFAIDDRACTDCARVFRLPGFLNRKYSPALPFTSEMRATHLEYSRSDFRLELPTLADVQSHRIDRPRSFGSRTRSESDWGWIMARLNAGIPAQEIVQTLANIRSDKPNAHYYAHRTVDIATAVQWVRKGVDRESLIEGLKAGSSGLSTDRDAEIAATAFRFVL